VSARRRRQGAADLLEVLRLAADDSGISIPIVSNGNVRTWEDVEANRAFTHAKGIMVGETLLGNPWYALWLLGCRCCAMLMCSPTFSPVYLPTSYQILFEYLSNISNIVGGTLTPQP